MLARRVLELDFDELSRWFLVRGEIMPERSIFPKTGFIIDGIAAGFLYFTDSSVAIIDGYISNPESDSKTRDYALDIITETLIDAARVNKFKIIKGDTKINSVKQRAINHGFKELGTYESFSREC